MPACSTPVTASSASFSRSPAVSTRSTSQPSRTTRVSSRSRVVPGSGDTMALAWPANALTRLLFPALTLPVTTTRQGRVSRRPTRAARPSLSRAPRASSRRSSATSLPTLANSASSTPASCRDRILAPFGPPAMASASRASASISDIPPARSHSGHACRTAPSCSRLAMTASDAARPPWQWISRASAPRRTTTNSSPGPSTALVQRPNTIAPSGRSASGCGPRGENSRAMHAWAPRPATPTTAKAPRPTGVSSAITTASSPTGRLSR